jgi:hypothetical protein
MLSLAISSSCLFLVAMISLRMWPCFAESAVLGGTPAGAQTSASLVQTDPQRNYAAIKKIITDIDNAERAAYPAGFGTPTELDLDHCASAAEYLGSAAQGDKIVPLANLAVDATKWSRNLQLMKYPDQVWEPRLRSYETAQLGEMRRAQGRQLEDRLLGRRQTFMKQFAAQLSSYQRSHPTLGKVVNEGSCRRPNDNYVRAGNRALEIATDPTGGSVFLIPTFFYELCRAQNIDPDDTARCNRWREAISGRQASVSGDYVYFVRWPDGATRRGKLSVVERDFGNSLVLRKQ